MSPSLSTDFFNQHFFHQHGASTADGQLRFGETPADFNKLEQKTTLSVMSTHCLLSVTSADNLKFMQGQFTCDLKEVSTTQWRYGALCTNKGRMIANFLLLQTAENRHLLRLSTETVEALQNTLKKFAPFYKGTLENLCNQYVLLGINGVEAATLVQSIAGEVPHLNGATQTAGIIIVRLAETRYELWIKNEQLSTLWSQLLSHATPTGPAYWELLNIRAGLGEIRQNTIEEWTPHMLNLQSIGAISFKKGCYTGQEIVARTEYRGQQKRAMYRITGQGTLPQPATPLHDSEQAAGEIVMAQWADNTHWEALAVIADPHLKHALTCENQPLHILDLPYPIKKKPAQ